MSSEPNEKAASGAVPPSLPATPAIPPVLGGGAKPSGSRGGLLCLILNLFLVLFLADALASLLDDSLVMAFGSHVFTTIRDLVGFVITVMALGVYVSMGLTPMVPKKWFLPLTLYFLVVFLLGVPLAIFFLDHMPLVDWFVSLSQLIVALVVYRLILSGTGFRWFPLMASHLGTRGFSGRNLLVFVGVNIFVLLPAIGIYLFSGAALAVGHFSEGFMTLHPGGFSVEVRKYVRNDGKVIELFPMAHVADGSFYDQVQETFPTNSIILMEGVTDEHNLLTNKISYERMARALGLSEQHQQFKPTRGQMVRADIDVDEFSTNTINLLNLVMLFHAKGLTPEVSQQLLQFTPPPDFEENLFGDLLGKRNQHLLSEIQTNLTLSDNIMVPWGVAHMPGISKEIQKEGFRLDETHEYMVIRFGGRH
jgi:hypothetical protein